MLLKKQTVWLLTMLSLVVVLSIYYITSPEQANDVATNEESNDSSETNGQLTDSDEIIISEASGDEVFAQLRYDLELQRSEKMEELTEAMASAELSTEEVNAMKEEMDQLDELKYKEEMLEMQIISMGFDDALVRTVDGKVHITVKSNDPSPSLANDILLLVHDELGSEFELVAVEYSPTE